MSEDKVVEKPISKIRYDTIKQKGLKTAITKGNKHCEDCNRYTRKFRCHKGMFLCYWDYIKRINIMGGAIRYSCRMLNVDQAINKIYEIRPLVNNSGYASGRLYTPKCLIGKKVKLVIVE